MQKIPLLVLDFDGVVIDGINEYWESSKKACSTILRSNPTFTEHDFGIFKSLRPWVHYGWEMVLICAELSKSDSNLSLIGVENYKKNYNENIIQGLNLLSLSPQLLQASLDDARKRTIDKDINSWLDSHKTYPNIADRLNKFKNEKIELAILTTKRADFTAKILQSLSIKVNSIYGHKSGSKTDCLLKISKEYELKGFVEDRRTTLETVIRTPGLESLRCFLASWGYLKPDDKNNLNSKIHLLEAETFLNPLANWV